LKKINDAGDDFSLENLDEKELTSVNTLLGNME
jgi:hypothetical protein